MKYANKNKMHPMKVSKNALIKYKSTVRGNDGISNELAARKITRNWLLGVNVKSDDSRFEVRHYGFLAITKDKTTKMIVDIKNKAHITVNKDFAYINEKKKTMFNLKLGINNK